MVFRIIFMEKLRIHPFLFQGDEVRIGGFDLIYNNGFVNQTPGSTYSTMLGAEVPVEVRPA